MAVSDLSVCYTSDDLPEEVVGVGCAVQLNCVPLSEAVSVARFPVGDSRCQTVQIR